MRSIHRSTLWAALLMTSALCLSAVAEEPKASPVAVASVGAAGISWQPQVDYEGMVLTISGDDFFLTRRFDAGETPRFNGIDDEGGSLQDGAYTWELSVIQRPVEAGRRSAANGRSDGDGTAGEPAVTGQQLRQSATFTIAGGAFVDPNQIEADAGPYND